MKLLKKKNLKKYKIQDHWKILQRKKVQRTQNSSAHHSQDRKMLNRGSLPNHCLHYYHI